MIKSTLPWFNRTTTTVTSITMFFPRSAAEFRKWDIPEKAKHPPAKPFRSDAPFEGITTVGVDYDGKRGAPAPSMKPEDKARQSTDPIDDKTSYRVGFICCN